MDMYGSVNQENSFISQQVHSFAERNDTAKNNLPKSRVKCQDCDLEFTSQVVLEAHLQGSRHAKQIRSKSILESLQKNNVSYSKDDETNGLKCSACNVYLNSIQQLHTHLNGTRHKKKVSQGDCTGQAIVSQMNNQHNFGQRAMVHNPPGIQMAANYIPQPISQPTNKQTLLSCQPCNKFFNSESQLSAHLASQKHIAKVDNKVAAKRRFVPYNRGRRGGINKANSNRKFFGRNISNSRPNPYHKPFVSAGFQMNS
ncbi:hypothetical protein QAD02_016927 [Eretmocerus hayati]|uniref:Uncharacterized protein n=1 Tax=Eretmocerus hayati TaxID=131215 RepID=A0ACC2PCJ5_9HYME|nr:hypothetical protein QAD02_016927 [Eretmocerus hayati]